jgi:hypothetical protein
MLWLGPCNPTMPLSACGCKAPSANQELHANSTPSSKATPEQLRRNPANASGVAPACWMLMGKYPTADALSTGLDTCTKSLAVEVSEVMTLAAIPVLKSLVEHR